jgi:indolepyruvate decarboxylase
MPRDMVSVPGIAQNRSVGLHEPSDPKALHAALADARAMINHARKPVILADVEIHRFGVQDQVRKLARRTNIPVAATLLGKSVIGERHPFYLGIYEGAMGRDDVRQYVESSDCVIMLGAFMTDINLGIYTARLDPARSIYITSEKLSVRYRTYEDVRFTDFVNGLLEMPLRRRARGRIPHPARLSNFKPKLGSSALTVKRLFARLNAGLRPDTVVVADVGDAMFGAADLFLPERTDFLGPAYYASMGFAVPAAIGAQLANPKSRPLVLVGDGAFQMTGIELATAARYKLNPIVILLNNRGYGTERHLQEGPYNDVAPWNYSLLPGLFGAGRSFLIETEAQLNRALTEAQRLKDEFCLLEVRLAQLDRSPALDRLAARLSQRL